MANEIDSELYPDNNAHSIARPSRWQANPTTGVEEQVLISGLSDLKLYLSLQKEAASEAAAVHPSLVYTMVEVLATAAYQATTSGSAHRTHLIAQPDGTKVYAHWQSTSAGYHEVAELIWRPNGRVAA